MPTLQELIDDAQIQDAMELTFGDNKFTMADLRAADKSRKAKYTAEEKRVKEQMDAAIAKQQELTTLASQAADLIAKLKEGETKPPVNKDGDIDFDTDPLYSPLVTKRLKPLEEKLAKFESAISTLNNSINDSAKFLLHDYYERRWNSIPEDRRPKDKGWKDYVKVASERHIMNEFNLPDPVEAFNREVEPQQHAEMQKKIDDLTKQLSDAKSAPRMPRPGATGVPAPKGADNKVYDNVDNLINDAFNDPTIQEIAGRA